MSRAKLFNLIKSRGENKIGRNPFDLSNRHVYTSKAGKIVPIKALHTYPDDYFEVNLSEFSQNNIPMNTAAFLAGKKELLAYFVPYNTIWHNFNQYQATREDPDSTLLKEQGISYEPRIRLFTLYDNALYFAIGQWLFKDYYKLLALRSIIVEADSPLTFTDGMKASEIIELASQTPDTNSPAVDMWTARCNSMYWTMRNDDDYLYKEFFSAADDDTFPLGVDFYCREYSRDHDESLSLFDTYTNILGNFVWCDWVQKMDMLGYGNIYPILKTFLDKMEKVVDDMLSISVLSISGIDKHLNFTYDDGSVYDLLSRYFNLTQTSKMYIFTDIVDSFRSKLGSFTHYTDSEGESQPEYVNVYAIYAYNKCFYEFMRNVYFDTNYSVYNYNCDFINGNSLEGSTIIGADLPLRWYHLESHQWKKDMFTGVLPDNQLGQVSELILNAGSSGTEAATLNVDLDLVGKTPSQELSLETANPTYPRNGFTKLINRDGVNLYQEHSNILVSRDNSHPSDASMQLLTGDDSYTLSRAETPHTHSLTGSVTQKNVDFTGSKATIDIPSLTGAGAAVLNVLALKRAEAIQQYRQDLMRAGNRTQDVFKQVYGTTPKSELDEAPYFIEVESNDINVNPIISTAQTGNELNGKLGDIAARVTIGGSSLNFKFSTKDFGVVIFMSYIVPESFYNSFRLDPFVTHLDQEAHGLPYFQNLGLQPVLGSALNNLQPSAVRHSTRGFAPPYLERKTDVDLVHGNLVDCMLGESGIVDVNYQGSLSHWVVARTDMQEEKTLSLRNFYINPRILDNVFTFNAQDDYETDHFLNYCSIQIQAVRAFSELGLPRF